jgi:general secretion pathway protein A
MSYYHTLGLVREPFSNSPDPDLLYRSKTHLECLQHMEIAVRLRRGLNVVLGEVGTGKTTLCRELMRVLAEDPDQEVYLLDDPFFPTVKDFLMALTRIFGLDMAGMAGDPIRLKNVIKGALSRKGEDGRRIVTLLVDEGQKMTGECLELLRELLNFETNTHKLLQIVIFAQKEFDQTLSARPNLDDRVNYRFELRPLDQRHTRRLIRTRLALCSPDGQTPALFTRLALGRIHRLTGGHPRKIVRLCHMSMLLCVGLSRRRVTWGLVGRAARETRGLVSGWRLRLPTLAAGAGLAAALVVVGFGLRAMLPTVDRTLTGVRTSLSAPPAAPEAAPALSPVAPEPVEAAHQPWIGPGVAEILASSHDADTASAVLAEAAPVAAESPEPAPVAEAALAEPSRPAADREVAVPAEASAVQAAGPVAAATGPAPEEQVVTVVAEAPARDQAPASLGSSVTRRGWIVSRQVAWLYGFTDRQYLAELAKANPGLDLNRIRAGQAVTFPAVAVAPLPAGSRLIRVEQAASLDEGFVFLAENRKCPLPLTLFVTYQPGSGLRFDVVVQAVYPGGEAAEADLAKLPPALAAKASLVEGYPRGTVYFSDLVTAAGRRLSPKSANPIVAQRQMASREAR